MTTQRRIVLLALLAAAVVALVYLTSMTRQAAPLAVAEQHDVYYCPMHPNYHSDKPGNCPVCQMKLVKLEKSGSAAAPAEAPAGAPANSIFVAPQKQQLIGMRSVAATVQPLVKDIRMAGKVAYDESKLTHIHTKVSGYIEEVYADYVGKPVRKDEPLFTIYSPDLVAAQQEYLLALKSRNVLSGSSLPGIAKNAGNLLLASRERLRLWDVTDRDIERLEREGDVKKTLTVDSPVNGVVMERTAYHHGTFVSPDKDLFTIVDLSRIWVIGDAPESELPFIRTGQMAEVEFPGAQGVKMLQGRVTFISPFFDAKTRTGQLRIEFSNPGNLLKPDMFATVVLHANLGDRLVVPQDALLSTGTEQYVFVDLGQGYVQPRLVQGGPATGESIAILSGLKAGERVVTGANFIVDAESRLKGAFANMGKPAQEAVAQTLKIRIAEPLRAKAGANRVRIVIEDASGRPLDGAEVEISVFMPQMGNMAPMSSKAALQNSGSGEYSGSLEIPMASTWQTTVTVRKGGPVLGSMQTSVIAQ